MILINCSNRENNCYKILNDIKSNDDKFISLSNKDMKFCLGCLSCSEKLEKHCVLSDYISNNVYEELIKANDIVFASPMYMGTINGVLKNLLDRLHPFYNHKLLSGKKIYLVMSGHATKEENEEEITGIIHYFEVISTYFDFKFEFLDYFSFNDSEYSRKIDGIKERFNR